MALRVVSCFSSLTRTDGWKDPHYCVNLFVNALKGRRVSGYGYVQVLPGEPRRRLDASNMQEAARWFGEMAADILVREGIEAPVLVPIPDSRAVLGAAVSRTAHLARATSEQVPGSIVADVLRFDQPMHSAHAQQGTRDAIWLHAHLRICGPLPQERSCVLVDDVLTTGGHLAAAHAVLRAHGADVALAICGASADLKPHPAPFERTVRFIADYYPVANRR